VAHKLATASFARGWSLFSVRIRYPPFALTGEEKAVILSSEDWPASQTDWRTKMRRGRGIRAHGANALYYADVPHLSEKCAYWHLSRFEWLYGPLPETPEQMIVN